MCFQRRTVYRAQFLSPPLNPAGISKTGKRIRIQPIGIFSQNAEVKAQSPSKMAILAIVNAKSFWCCAPKNSSVHLGFARLSQTLCQRTPPPRGSQPDWELVGKQVLAAGPPPPALRKPLGEGIELILHFQDFSNIFQCIFSCLLFLRARFPLPYAKHTPKSHPSLSTPPPPLGHPFGWLYIPNPFC